MNKKTRYTSAAIVALAAICLAAGIPQLQNTRTVSSASSAQNPETPGQTASRNTDRSAVTEMEHFDSFKGVDSYQTLYQALSDLYEQNNAVYESSGSSPLRNLFTTGADKEMEATEDISAEGAAQEDSSSQSAEYSETNIQELGVDEADVIKTDGKYLYILKSGGQIQIVSANGADSQIVAAIEQSAFDETAADMYVDGNTLNLIATGCDTSMRKSNTEDDSAPAQNSLIDEIYEVDNHQYTRLYTYDISDRSNPKLTGTVSQEGYYSTSRKNGDIVYLFTSYYPDLDRTDDPKYYVPTVNGSLLKESDICLPENISNTGYLVMSSVNVTDPTEPVDTKAVVSGAQDFYISNENIYITNTTWNQETRTELLKFHYSEGKITNADAASLKGYLNDSFSLNEYNGYLRVVLTESTMNTDTNSLYVLDDSLNICGSIKDIAEGETIQSARFMGDTGYFVTYRNMDPLFSVDLSDPNQPKILGELKITGFSSYLHFYGENKLLGIGYETDPDTGETYGIKLSMFDISNPSDVTESNKYVIKDTWDCSVLYDYKAVMLDTDKNVIGFTCDDQYMIFTYDNADGFKNVFAKKLNTNQSSVYYDSIAGSYGGYGYARGCYVNNTFYLICNNSILIYDMEHDYETLGKVDLQ